MKEGDVVLTPVPQANGLVKNRPAVFLRELPCYRDLLVCGRSSGDIIQLSLNQLDALKDMLKEDERVLIHRMGCCSARM
jgi:hypothetical protein